MELTANALQVVEANQNILFTDTAIAGQVAAPFYIVLAVDQLL